MKKGPFYRKYIRPIKHLLGYWIVLVLAGIARTIPRRIALWKVDLLGGIFYSLSGKDRKIALNNIAIVFPETSEKMRESLAKESFRQNAKNFFDTFRVKEIVESEPPIWRIEGDEIVREAIERCGGGIVITGHIGCFELLPGIWRRLGVNVAAVGRRLFDERIDRLLVRQRESMGVVNIPSDAHPRAVLSLAKSGYFIGTLIDTYTKSVDGRPVEFFGRMVRTISAPAGLARLLDRPLLPMAIYREGKDHFLLKVWPLVEIPKSGDKERDFDELLRRANKVIEEMILFKPNQWIWYHDRFHL